jgi:hypothetical protein
MKMEIEELPGLTPNFELDWSVHALMRDQNVRAWPVSPKGVI